MHLHPETGSRADDESTSNSNPFDEAENVMGIAPKSQPQTLSKSYDHHGSCSNPVFSFPTLQAALTYHTSHTYHNVAPLATPNQPSQSNMPAPSQPLNLPIRTRFICGRKSFLPRAPENFLCQRLTRLHGLSAGVLALAWHPLTRPVGTLRGRDLRGGGGISTK